MIARVQGETGRVPSTVRPLWARVLDTVADVLLWVGLAVAGVLLLASAASLLGASATTVGAWLTGTGLPLVGPIDAVVDVPEESRDLALALAMGAVVWAAVGWAVSRLLRPG